MALLALPPDALVGAGDHVGRLQVAAALLVPLPRDPGMRRPQVVVAFQHLAVAAVGATAVGAAGPVVGGCLPCVPTPASPPDPPRAAGDDAVGPQVAVAIPIPLSHELRIRSSQVVETAQQLAVLAVRAAVVNAHGAHAHLLAPQVNVDPLVECDGVTVATRLPIAGEAGFDQQPLALVVVVGRNLSRQCGTRAHYRHPFCQDEKTLKAPICWIIGLICSFLYCQWHCGQRIAPANRGNRFAHNKKRPTTIRRVGSSSKTASLP